MGLRHPVASKDEANIVADRIKLKKAKHSNVDLITLQHCNTLQHTATHRNMPPDQILLNERKTFQ